MSAPHEAHTINRFDRKVWRAQICVIEKQYEDPICVHIGRVRKVRPSGSGCVDCAGTGDIWLQLRMCMECGHVGCCDSSKNKHAKGHFIATQHPITRSLEPGEAWAWCYIDQLWFERLELP